MLWMRTSHCHINWTMCVCSVLPVVICRDTMPGFCHSLEVEFCIMSCAGLVLMMGASWHMPRFIPWPLNFAHLARSEPMEFFTFSNFFVIVSFFLMSHGRNGQIAKYLVMSHTESHVRKMNLEARVKFFQILLKNSFQMRGNSFRSKNDTFHVFHQLKLFHTRRRNAPLKRSRFF